MAWRLQAWVMDEYDIKDGCSLLFDSKIGDFDGKEEKSWRYTQSQRHR